MLTSIDDAIIAQAIQAAAQEAGLKLVRAAHSTILREAQDGSAALLDRRGNVVALAELIPVQLGAMGVTLRACLAHYPVETLSPGDFLINNDPYEGGQHLQDIYIFTPIFVDGQIIGFGGSVAHHLDIGGGNAGLHMAATEIYQEGLRIPPSRYNIKRDWNGGPFERLLFSNFRVPHETIGDINAQFAANDIATLRLVELCGKYGVDAVMACMDRMLDYTESRVRSSIRTLPDGVYEGHDAIDDDGAGSGPIDVWARITIAGDSIEVDMTRTHAQLDNNLNAPLASGLAAVLSSIKMVLTGPDVPFNEGAIRPVTILAPEGTIVNPNFPAAVRARMTTANRVYGAVKDALSKAAQNLATAQGFETTTVIVLAHRREGGFSICTDPQGGGFGATHLGDGCDAVDSPMTNCSNSPIESFDANFDFFAVVSARLVANFGHGRTRGGCGYARRYRILRDGVDFGMYSDRFVRRPRGLGGGHDGGLASCTLYSLDGTTTNLPSKFHLRLNAGDEIEVVLGGGAGLGDPATRDRRLVLRDMRDGLISQEVARDVYKLDSVALAG